MDPYALAISNRIVAMDNFLDLASFRVAQTIEICSQHPGTVSIQPFCTDLGILLGHLFSFVHANKLKLAISLSNLCSCS